MLSNAETSPSTMSADETAAVEKFIVDTQFRIYHLMRARRVSRKALADALGVSKARVSQMFGDNSNITLETLARIFYVLGEQCKVTSEGVEYALAELERDIALERMPDTQPRRRTWRHASPGRRKTTRPAHATSTAFVKAGDLNQNSGKWATVRGRMRGSTPQASAPAGDINVLEAPQAA